MTSGRYLPRVVVSGQCGGAGQWPGQCMWGEWRHGPDDDGSILLALVKYTTPQKTIHDNVGEPILQPVPKLPAKHIPAANAVCCATAPATASPPLEHCTSPPPFEPRQTESAGVTSGRTPIQYPPPQQIPQPVGRPQRRRNAGFFTGMSVTPSLLPP